MHYTHSAVPVRYDDDWECRTCGSPVVDPETPAARHHDERQPETPAQRLPSLTRNVAPTGPRATSNLAADAALPKTGTLRRQVFDAITAGGRTDDEVEVLLGRTHQSVSASRFTLARDGWVEPLLDEDGKAVTRPTRTGNAATVWTPTAASRQQRAGAA